jgi:hypothetical protein
MKEQKHATGTRERSDEKPPNPGSAEARQLGCKCAVIDNGYGCGCGYQDDAGNPLFWITEGCPLHDAG